MEEEIREIVKKSELYYTAGKINRYVNESI